MGDEVAKLLIKETRYRLLDESIPRLNKCLDKLTEEEIWYRPNSNTVSIGNLVLHLCGNVRQWLICGLGDAVDNRQRHQEFNETGPIPCSELRNNLSSLGSEIDKVLAELSPPELLSSQSIQGYEVTGVSILVHVVEHFSYHVGQATILVKSRKDVDMGYYAGKNLDQHNQ